MMINRRSLWALGLALILLISLTGCGLFGRTKKSGPVGDLKMKVAVAPFDDPLNLVEKELSGKTAALLAKYLDESRDVLVIGPAEVQNFLTAKQIPTPLTQNSAVLLGRSLGVNAMVIGSLSEFSQIQERTGWLRWLTFWSKKKDFIKAVLSVKVVDPAQGTIIAADVGRGMTQTGQKEEDLWMGNPSQGLDESLLKASLEKAAQALAESLVRELKQTRWQGFILDVSGDTALLSGGRDVGIKPGHRFVVFSAGEKVTNAAGQVYIIPGPVKAQLAAEQVLERTTKLRIMSGEVHPGEAAQYTE